MWTFVRSRAYGRGHQELSTATVKRLELVWFDHVTQHDTLKTVPTSLASLLSRADTMSVDTLINSVDVVKRYI